MMPVINVSIAGKNSREENENSVLLNVARRILSYSRRDVFIAVRILGQKVILKNIVPPNA